MTHRISSLIFILIFFSCNYRTERRVLVGDVFAVGNISKDTVYHGLIKFYDTASNRLVVSANYSLGVLEGERIDYYNNGKIQSKLNYEKGESHGELINFDSLGNITMLQNFFHGLRVGSSLRLKKGIPNQYYFYSLENTELLHFDYDSIVGKKIGQLSDNGFFFWHLNEFITSDSNDKQKELFIYTPNPPKLNFHYSLCIIDSQYNIRTVLKEFDTRRIWNNITLDNQNLKEGELFAIRLEVDNEFDTKQRHAVMFKKV